MGSSTAFRETESKRVIWRPKRRAERVRSSTGLGNAETPRIAPVTPEHATRLRAPENGERRFHLGDMAVEETGLIYKHSFSVDEVPVSGMSAVSSPGGNRTRALRAPVSRSRGRRRFHAAVASAVGLATRLRTRRPECETVFGETHGRPVPYVGPRVIGVLGSRRAESPTASTRLTRESEGSEHL